jgi:hypothetical protein
MSEGAPLVHRYLTHIPQDVEDMFQYYQQEYISMILDQKSKETGYLCGRIEVIDLQGVAWGIRGEIRRLRKCWEYRSERLGYHLDECFPEHASHVFVVNSPSWFSSLWAIASPFIPSNTLEKIKVATADKSPRLLRCFIADEVLPRDFGGEYDGAWVMGKVTIAPNLSQQT